MAESIEKENRFFKKAKERARSIAGDGEQLNELVSASKEKLHSLNFENSRISKLGNHLRVMLRMIQAYVNGSYRDVPWKSILAFVAGVVYFMMPIDLMPDFIPLTGLLDDFTVIMLITGAFQQDIEEFLLWEEKDL